MVESITGRHGEGFAWTLSRAQLSINQLPNTRIKIVPDGTARDAVCEYIPKGGKSIFQKAKSYRLFSILQLYQ